MLVTWPKGPGFNCIIKGNSLPILNIHPNSESKGSEVLRMCTVGTTGYRLSMPGVSTVHIRGGAEPLQ